MKFGISLASAGLLLLCAGCGDDAKEVVTPDAGELVCAATDVNCSGSCVNPAIDPSFCGASADCADTNVGVSCGDGSACVAGGCVEIAACDTSLPGTPGLTLSPLSGTAIEGGVAVTYTASLDAEPCANVYLTLTGDIQVGASTDSLTFSTENWDQPQTVEVTAVHDFDIEGSHEGTIEHVVASGDDRYDTSTNASLKVAIEDRAHLMHVSVSTAGAGTDGDSTTPQVSDNGKWVTFESSATDLVNGDEAGFDDIFLRNMETKVTRRVTQAGAEADGDSTKPRISSDGARIAFLSSAANLSDDPITAVGEIYLYDRATGLINLISGPCEGCNLEIGAAAVAISGDGTSIAFGTRRRVLGTDVENEYDTFVAREDDATIQASLNSAGQNGSNFWGSNAFQETLSATGQFVGFSTAARNLATPEITVQNFHSYVKDLTSGSLTRVSLHSGGTDNCDGTHQVSSSGSPLVSSDGNLAAYYSDCALTLAVGTDTNAARDIFLRNISAETTTRISVASDGTEADGASNLLGMSDDGAIILFSSDATNLVPGDTNAATDLFVHDTGTGTTSRVGLGLDYGELADGITGGGLSRNGQFAVFTTITNALSTDDNVEMIDVYRVQLR